MRTIIVTLLYVTSALGMPLSGILLQNQTTDKQGGSLPASGTVTAELSVKAGETITFHIELDKPADAPRSYLNVGVRGPENATTGSSIALEIGKTGYDISVSIPPDAPGGRWHLVSVSVGTVSGMHSSAITFDPVSFEVIQNSKFVLPTAAKVSINPSQSQLLRREAARLENKIQVLKASLLAPTEQKGDGRVTTILKDNIFDAEKALELTEMEFLKLVSTQTQQPIANIFFGDLHITYERALEKLDGTHSHVPRVNYVQQSYPLLAEPVLRAFEQNELAYKVVADAGSLTFDLEVDTIPQGANVSYRRRGDSFEHLQNTTNSVIKTLPYAIWFVRFEKSGFRTEDREHDPFHEQNHVITVELQSEKR